MDAKRLQDTNSLIFAAKDGNAEAVELLYQRYIRRAEKWVSGRVPQQARSLHDTKSVAHDVLVRALFRAASEDFEVRGSFAPYVRAAIRNRLRNLGSRSPKTQPVESLELVSEAPTELERMLDAEMQERLNRIVLSLPREAREILLLRFGRELSHRELAEALGLPSEDAARMRVRRTLDQVKDKWESSEGEQ